jgi:hypothetical protein
VAEVIVRIPLTVDTGEFSLSLNGKQALVQQWGIFFGASVAKSQRFVPTNRWIRYKAVQSINAEHC